ncbi:pyrroline-5-carboxylate reductase [Polaromonas sp.]|nr:pyrroline-5-carboxylate reductase [Polaromonas sp.]
MPHTSPDNRSPQIAFIGGGNMASAIIGGLLKRGLQTQQIQVIEPFAEQRAALAAQFQIAVSAAPSAALASATLVVWAVKPQILRQAIAQGRAHTSAALHLSVAPGISSDTLANWLGSERIVRAMPNTPALIGQGMTGLFARSSVNAADRLSVEQVVQTTGEFLWLEQETQLDAVTALSGSGPAYIFCFIEAMVQAGVGMGLSPQQAHQLAVSTFVGASALAQQAGEAPEVLRARVTSKDGTTYAALTAMEQSDIKGSFIQAMQAARQRAIEMGHEFGNSTVA